MLAITKGAEPADLAAYRAVPGATYDGKDFTPVKAEIRRALLRDQLAVCCYCMQRISDEERPRGSDPNARPLPLMKVEHWRSQVEHAPLQLAWSNMLGACPGGEGRARSDQTCDTYKGEEKITLNPLDPAHMATLRCKSDGRLFSTDEQFQSDIKDRLNLNSRVLVAARKAMLVRDLTPLMSRNTKSEISVSTLRRRIEELESPVKIQLAGPREATGRRDLCGVLRLWARQRFPETPW